MNCHFIRLTYHLLPCEIHQLLFVIWRHSDPFSRTMLCFCLNLCKTCFNVRETGHVSHIVRINNVLLRESIWNSNSTSGVLRCHGFNAWNFFLFLTLWLLLRCWLRFNWFCSLLFFHGCLLRLTLSLWCITWINYLLYISASERLGECIYDQFLSWDLFKIFAFKRRVHLKN